VASAACTTYYTSDGVHHHDGTAGNDTCDGNTNFSSGHNEDFFLASGDDSSRGYNLPDNMKMWTGDDTAHGGGGDDNLFMRDNTTLEASYGGDGNDEIYGGYGPDSIEGEEKGDYLADTSSDSPFEKDHLYACDGAGTDTLNAQDGDNDDTLNYNPGDVVQYDILPDGSKDAVGPC
jgi:Ca2+-binding RTX toxin-like protein